MLRKQKLEKDKFIISNCLFSFMREYRFTGQWMFYVAAIICFFTVLFIPLGVWFIISARRARIKIDEDFFSYTMFTEKVIRFKEIKTLKLGKKVEVRYKVGYVIPTFATVVPLIVEMKNEKMIKQTCEIYA